MSALVDQVRLYNHLFTVEEVSDEQWESQLNPESEQVMRGALVDESILKWQPRVEDHFQFERIGFFVVDKDSGNAGDGSLVFNLTVPLKDTSKPKDGQAGAPKSRKEEQEKQLEAKLVRVNYNFFRHMTNQ